MAAKEFFCRIDGFDMKPGSKQSGFTVVLDGESAVRLRNIKITEKDASSLNEMVASRLAHAEVVNEAIQKSCRVILAESSAFPKIIMTSGIGGSIGLDGEEVRRLGLDDANQWVGPVVEMTPHNVDSPKEALALMVMVQTWAEWAHTQMLCSDWREKHNAAADT